MSGGDATQNGAPPPPPPPTGSPFGRFLTQPVFLVALVALMISLPLVALSLDGGSEHSSPQAGDPLNAVQGRWTAIPSDAHGGVDLFIRSRPGANDGRLTRIGVATCSGTLTYVRTSGDTVVFDYTERRSRDACPARSTVELTPLDGDRLRLQETRNGRVVADDVLTAP